VCHNGCSATKVIRCKNHRASRCHSCSTHYRIRVERLAAEGMHRRSTHGHQGMLTLTCPSDGDHDQWVIAWDRRTPRPRCGCHQSLVHGMGSWNASASARWNRLRTALRREYPALVFFRAVEVQQRGAIHLHVIVWTARPLDLQRVQALAMAAGFGCVLDWSPARPGSTAAARYVSKYVTKSCDLRGSTPWDVLDRDTGEITRAPDATYRTWSCSALWGLKMRELEAALRDAARRRAAAHREQTSDPDDDGDSARPATARPPSPA
jgi:hypothetical protein